MIGINHAMTGPIASRAPSARAPRHRRRTRRNATVRSHRRSRSATVGRPSAPRPRAPGHPAKPRPLVGKLRHASSVPQTPSGSTESAGRDRRPRVDSARDEGTGGSPRRPRPRCDRVAHGVRGLHGRQRARGRDAGAGTRAVELIRGGAAEVVRLPPDRSAIPSRALPRHRPEERLRGAPRTGGSGSASRTSPRTWRCSRTPAIRR